jgi:hypothetical protein
MKRSTWLGMAVSVWVGVACAPAGVEAPQGSSVEAPAAGQELLSAEELDALSCEATLTGEVSEVGSAATARGIVRVTYRLDAATQAMTLEGWDAGGALVARLEAELWQEDELTGRAAVRVYGADGALRLEELGRARLELGFGQRFEVTRRVGDEEVRVVAQLTSEPAANRLVVSRSAAAGAPGARPGLSGPEIALDVLDRDGAFAVTREEVETWAEAQGVAAALGGEWDQVKAALLEDEGVRRRLYTHTLWCGMSPAEQAQSRAAAEAASQKRARAGSSDGLEQRATPLTCRQEEVAKEVTRDTVAALDFVSTHAGKLALASPAEYLLDNSGDLGLKITIDAGRYGKYSFTKGDYNTVRDFAKALVLGPAILIGGGPFGALGIALAGFSAATYIGARVVEAFGEDAIRDYLEERNRARERAEIREAEARREATERYLAEQEAKRSRANSTGDPHMTTHDGLTYSFQAAGEFWLARSLDGALQVQSRQEPLPGERCPGSVSGNSAVAVQADGHRIVIYADRPALWIDGMEVEATGPGFPLPGGGEVALEDEDWVVVRTSGGDTVRARRSASMLHVNVYPSLLRAGQVEGLLGDFDGEMSNDLRLPDGTTLEIPVSAEALYGELAAAWRVQREEERLFPDGTLGSFDQPSYPATLIDVEDIPEAARSEAEATCQGAGVEAAGPLRQCVVDVYCTGEEVLATEHARRRAPRLFAEVVAGGAPDVATPLNYSGWSHFGPAERDGWSVSAEGDVVTYTSNGDPAAYISGRRYSSVVLEGFLSVPNAEGDDDLIGLVTGLDASDAERLEAVVIQWKGGEQPPAREGLVIARASIPFASFSEDQLWAQQETTGYTILTASWGEGTGWREGQSVPFTLVVNPTRLTLRLQGFEAGGQWIVDGAFPAGRVGFYDYSQPGAQWAYVTERRPVFEDDFISVCESTATSYPGGEGSEHLVTCPPGCEPRIIWGTDVYVNDSSICTAAVHAGVITAAGGGAVRILKGADAGSYTASTRFGVTSEAYGEDDGSFTFVR